MNIAQTVAQLESQIREIVLLQEQNQREQANISIRIKELEAETKKQYQLQSQLDNEAIQLFQQAEKIQSKLDRIKRIAHLSQEFQRLQKEFKEDQELLETLYSSMMFEVVESNNDNSGNERSEDAELFDLLYNEPDEDRHDRIENLTIETIKVSLPNAEEVHQQLIEWYFEKYQTYKDCILGELSVTWYAVAFIVFGRSLYHKLSRQHHPDFQGSDDAMQLINAAWEISEDYLANIAV